MKKPIFWAIALVLIIVAGAIVFSHSFTNNKIRNAPEIGSKFSSNDLIFGKLYFGMSEKEVIKLMGTPDDRKTFDGNELGDKPQISLIYAGATLRFSKENGKFIFDAAQAPWSAETKETELAQNFIRGVGIGSTKDEVLNAFYHEDEFIQSEKRKEWKYLYGADFDNTLSQANQSDTSLSNDPISLGTISEYDVQTVIEYTYYPEENRVAGYAGNYYKIFFDLDKSNVVQFISWYHGVDGKK